MLFLGKKFYFPALMSDTAQDGYSDFSCFQEISDFSDFQSFPKEHQILTQILQ